MNRILKLIYSMMFVTLCLSCATGSTYPDNAVVAVWDFDNLTPSVYAQPDLGELLSSQVIETLQKKGGHPLVERDRLLLALKELQLGTTAVADESTRLRLGKLSGASLMVFGGYQIIGDRMRLDVRLVDVESGRVIKAVHKISSTSDLSGWLAGAQEAAEELL